TALGEIRALQAREQARAGAPEGAGSSTYVTPLFVKKTLCHNLGVSSKHS
nr:hypothetical protein [Tanacetum cinerariifolium]